MTLRATARVAGVVLTAVVLTTLPAGAEQACAQVPQQIEAKLGAFSEGSLSRPMYWVAESSGQATLTVLVPEISCDGSTSSVSFSFQDKTTNASDFVHQNAPPVQWANTAGHSPSYRTNVSITDDALAIPGLDDGTEYAIVTLESQSNVTIVEPKSAALIIVDDDGPTTGFSMVEGTYGGNETTATAGIPVFRSGSTTQLTSVGYTVSGGTATAGADYQASASGTLNFPANDRMEIIPITIVDDQAKETTEKVTVALTGDGITGTTSVEFSIADNEESFPPTSTLHHPRQNWKYRASDYRIQEIHIFTEDTGGAGVVSSEFALRRNMKNKTCAWWTGKKFKKGKCSQQRWLKTGQYEPDFYFIRVKELAPSVGPIKNYTAFSRAIDGAHNLETLLEVGRNENTFEVKKPK